VRGYVWPALVALLVCAAPAAAAPVRVSGQLIVRWQSNPATCAGPGLCDRWGTLAWRPEADSGSIDVGSGDVGSLSFYGAPAVARSYRRDGGSIASCIDRNVAPRDVQIQSGASRNTLVYTMREIVEFSFGRCAGPLGVDFARALPQAPAIQAAALRRGALIDLRARTPFASGPFEGEVISTITIRPRRERDTSGGSESQTVPPRRERLVRYGQLTASYAVESLSGDAGYALSGAPAAECAPFDTCGLTGDVVLHADVHQGSVRLTSVRRLPLGARETVGSALRALRSGGTRFFGDAFLGPAETDPEAPFAIPLSATATPGGGARCADEGSFREPYLELRRRRAGIAMRLRHGGNDDPDPLRTRCPGPGSADVGSLASGVLPAASIGAERITMTLRPGSFTMPGLRGSGLGDVRLSLRLVSLRARARTERVQHDAL
jgi:hypothetical protein